MNFKSNLLLLTAVVLTGRVFACEVDEAADDRGSKKCLKVNNLTVCNNATIGALAVLSNETVGGNLSVAGSETIAGSLTVTTSICAASIALCPAAPAGTPGVPGIGGALAFGEAGNITAGITVTTASGTASPATQFVPFTYTNDLNGLTLGGTANALVPATTGVYMYMYEVGVDLAVSGTNNVGFDLYDQTAAAVIPDSAFGSNLGVSVAALADKVVGFGVATLTAGHAISIRNISGVTVTVANLPTFGGEAVNIGKLRLIRIA